MAVGEEMPEEMGYRFMVMMKIDLLLASGDRPAAVKLMEKLRDSFDKIRRNYWQWKINRLQ